VRLAPVLERLETLALVPHELQIELPGGHDPRLHNLDDRDRLVVEAEERQALPGINGLLLLGEARRCGLLAAEDSVDQPAAELRARVPDLEWSEVVQRTSASRRSLGSGPGSRST
jgi:hypothetical protein